MPSWSLRRLVIAPLMPLLFVLAALVTLAAIPLSLLVCPVLAAVSRGRPRWRLMRVCAAATAYLGIEVACLPACLALWLATGFGWRLRAAWAVRAHRTMLAGFLHVVLRVFRRCFGFVVELEEPREPIDALHQDAPVLVLARHAGPGASFALVHQLIHRYRRDVCVVLKGTLRLDPAIDLLLSRTECVWVVHEVGGGAESVAAAARNLGRRGALLLFPEGADWTPGRHLAAVLSLRRRGLGAEAKAALRMPHVLPPRPAGTIAAISAAPFAPVLIFTHTGHDELLDAASSWAALPLSRPLRMCWWQDRRKVTADGEDAIKHWLTSTWEQIDCWVDEQQQLLEMTHVSTEGKATTT